VMSRCTLYPKSLQRWFDIRFADLCKEHDEHYQERKWRVKYHADFLLAAQFCKRGYCIIGFASIPYTVGLGTLFFGWKYLQDKVIR